MEHVKENGNRVSKYFNLPPLRQLEQEDGLEKENKYYTPTYKMVQPNYIFGIEVEVEEVRYPEIQSYNKSYWNITQDNSLRNNGYEFVSLPLKAKLLENALTQLQRSLPPSHSFSPRTSVHVHMNVRDLTIEQICSLVILYVTCENLLFNWVGHERDKSIFCIKLLETNYRTSILNLLEHTSHTIYNWNKYTALNLHPIQSIGTVEFRHMEGNIDIPRILTWINFLSSLKAYTKTTSIQRLLNMVMNLNSSSEYVPFLQNIFKDLTINLLGNMDDEEIKHHMEEAVCYIKTCYNVLEQHKKHTITPTNYQNTLDDMVRTLNRTAMRAAEAPRLNTDIYTRLRERDQEEARIDVPNEIRGTTGPRPQINPFFTTTDMTTGGTGTTRLNTNTVQNFWTTDFTITTDDAIEDMINELPIGAR